MAFASCGMKSFEREAILENFKELVETVKVHNVVDHLIQKKMLSIKDWENVSSVANKTSFDQTRCLIQFIMSSDKPEAFQHFVASLQETYDFLARKLNETCTSLRRKARPIRKEAGMIRDSSMLQDISGESEELNDLNVLGPSQESSLSLDLNIGIQETSIKTEEQNAECFLETQYESQEYTIMEPTYEESEKFPAEDNRPTNMPEKRRMGSSRRNMRVSSSSFEAGISKRASLTPSMDGGKDYLDGFTCTQSVVPPDSLTLTEDIHYVYILKPSVHDQLGVSLQESRLCDGIEIYILPGGLASKETDLRDGDILRYVNGVDVQGKALEEVTRLITNHKNGPQIILGVVRSGYFYKCRLGISLERGNSEMSYGLKYISGAIRPRCPGDEVYYVTYVQENSVADGHGVKVGDTIASINGKDLSSLRKTGQVEALFQESCKVHLTLIRHIYSEENPGHEY